MFIEHKYLYKKSVKNQFKSAKIKKEHNSILTVFCSYIITITGTHCFGLWFGLYETKKLPLLFILGWIS